MATSAVNPWSWQEALNFSHAIDVRGAERVLFCAGQTSVDSEGRVLHPHDMGGQLGQAFDNLETVLSRAGLTMENVVRLNYYVTDMDAFAAARQVVADRLASLAIKPSGTLLGISRLAQPDLLVEIEATAAA
ncbi:MAG TPA: RidA family protein [Gammaproteobacteria bacterium]|nr:RidA family protein [Gammaproteobacteria bacterium]